MLVSLFRLENKPPASALRARQGRPHVDPCHRGVLDLHDAHARQQSLRRSAILRGDRVACRVERGGVDAERGEDRAPRLVRRDPAMAVVVEELVDNAGASGKLAE